MNKISCLTLGAVSLSVLAIATRAEEPTLHTFKKVHLTDEFWSEGANIGDFNHDGKPDVVSGPYWWEGPDFTVRHAYYPATKSFRMKRDDGSEVIHAGFKGALSKENTYSDNFFAFSYDFTKDGWDDILILGFPGDISAWYENPRGGDGYWKQNIIFGVTDNESPSFADLTGDGKPELICATSAELVPKQRKGQLGYATPDWGNPAKPWTFHAISPPEARFQRFTHGLGFGDVNGDGKNDLLEANGWWEQPASLDGDPLWTMHKWPFAPGHGSAHMFAYDVNGDGRNDVVTGLAAHGYGLAWYEQLAERKDGEIQFQPHIVMNKEPGENKYGVSFSQLHAMDLVDMDGDGLKDLITGKRFWAHGPTGDADPNGAAVLYWFKLVRGANHSVDYIPYRIDDNSGIGTQVVARDANGDGLPDIIVGNKKGTFVHWHAKKSVSADEWKNAQPKPYSPTSAAVR